MISIEINPIEILALKKLALISNALAISLSDKSARTEQAALTRVLMDVVARVETAVALIDD